MTLDDLAEYSMPRSVARSLRQLSFSFCLSSTFLQTYSDLDNGSESLTLDVVKSESLYRGVHEVERLFYPLLEGLYVILWRLLDWNFCHLL